MPIRVLIADASSAVRARLRELLSDRPEIDVLEEEADGAEALTRCLELRPDVLLLDELLPNANWLAILDGIRLAKVATRVVILSEKTSSHWIRLVLDSGASGYLSKDSDLLDLAPTILAVHAGQLRLSPEVLRLVLEVGPSGGHDRLRPATLTAREKQVLQLIAQRKTSKEISALLAISPRTVDAHRANIMKKVGAHSVSDLIRFESSRHPPGSP